MKTIEKSGGPRLVRNDWLIHLIVIDASTTFSD